MTKRQKLEFLEHRVLVLSQLRETKPLDATQSKALTAFTEIASDYRRSIARDRKEGVVK